jgi:uncharacterized protein
MGNKKRSVELILLALMFASISAVASFADEVTVAIIKYAADNGNLVVIDDLANLLSEEEKDNLLENMKAVTEYGHAAFISVGYNDYSAEEYARNRYGALFGDQSGTLFLIDMDLDMGMDNRMIKFYSDGKFARIINNTRSNEIADNIYAYASKEKYFECANEAFNQVLMLLKGERIFTPMKYATNALMALCLALLANFLVAAISRKRNVAINKIDRSHAVIDLNEKTKFIKKINSKMISQTRTLSSDSDSGSSSGGGGGGGGGSSGGHSF